MSRLMITSVFLFGLLLPLASAQEEKKDKFETTKEEFYPKKTLGGPVGSERIIPGDCEIHFLNGSKVRMIIQSEKLDIATAYGKLSVPIKDVRAIEFGLHLPEGMETA